MPMPLTAPATTLLAHAGTTLQPAEPARAALVLVAVQEEYRNGRLPLVGVDAALDEICRLLHRMRRSGLPAIQGGGMQPDRELWVRNERVAEKSGFVPSNKWH